MSIGKDTIPLGCALPLIGGVAVLCFAPLFLGKDRTVDRPVTQTNAAKLAALEVGILEGEESAVEHLFQQKLNRLKKKCFENEDEITSLTFAAREVLKKHGIEEKMLAIMSGLDAAILEEQIERVSYKTCVAAYVALRKQGVSHHGSLLRVSTEVVQPELE